MGCINVSFDIVSFLMGNEGRGGGGQSAIFSITQLPQDYTGQIGEIATFSIAAVGDGLSYMWEFKNFDSSWTTSSSTIPTATCEISLNRDRRQYRCTITDSHGNSITSGPATLYIPLIITSQPQNYIGQVNDVASFTIETNKDGASLTYVWEFKDVDDIWKTSSATTATATCSITQARDGRQYRCTVTDNYGDSITSEAATLIVQ